MQIKAMLDDYPLDLIKYSLYKNNNIVSDTINSMLEEDLLKVINYFMIKINN